MHILVTGGAGNIGHTVVAHLLAEGHAVSVVDRMSESDAAQALGDSAARSAYFAVDMTDYAALKPCFAGVDAVVHLAAIPDPIPGKCEVVFHTNCTGAFNVFSAAAAHGVKRVVAASSINVMGNGYGIRPLDIRYFPLDEAHPKSTTDAYSFSKQVLEDMGVYFWRREGISSVLLRFPGVLHPEWITPELAAQHLAMSREAHAALSAMPENERKAQLRQLIALDEKFRIDRDRGGHEHEPMETIRSIPGAILLWGRSDFWAMLDVRDAAQACAKGVTAQYEGSHPLWIVDPVNAAGLPAADLAAWFYPQVTEYRRPLEGMSSLISIDRARELIGYDPAYSLSRFTAVD